MFIHTVSMCMIILTFMMICISQLLKNTQMKKSKEKMSSFECGFDSEHKMRNSFSLRFFIITVIFLIFDTEMTAMFPLPLINKTFTHTPFLLINMLFVMLLMGGLLFEWSQGALQWK